MSESSLIPFVVGLSAIFMIIVLCVCIIPYLYSRATLLCSHCGQRLAMDDIMKRDGDFKCRFCGAKVAKGKY